MQCFSAEERKVIGYNQIVIERYPRKHTPSEWNIAQNNSLSKYCLWGQWNTYSHWKSSIRCVWFLVIASFSVWGQKLIKYRLITSLFVLFLLQADYNKSYDCYKWGLLRTKLRSMNCFLDELTVCLKHSKSN